MAKVRRWKSDDGMVELINGDSLRELAELREKGEVVQLIATDPPYSSGGFTRGDRMVATGEKYRSTGAEKEHPDFMGDNRDQRGFLQWSTLWMLDCFDICEPGGVLAAFTDWRQLAVTTDAVQAAGFIFRGIVPWDKGNARPQPNRFTSRCEYVVWGTNGARDSNLEGATYHDGILVGAAPPSVARVHTTQKPVEVMAKICELAKPGELVLDPFMGSGTTGVAAVRTGRRFIGIEKSPKYFDIAVDRLKEEQASLKLIAGAMESQRGFAFND